jgi:hypothetical protein
VQEKQEIGPAAPLGEAVGPTKPDELVAKRAGMMLTFIITHFFATTIRS